MKKLSQADLILQLLSDGEAHSTVEIQEKVYGSDHAGSAAIPSRISDLNAREGIEIKGKPGKVNKTVWWYKLIKNDSPTVPQKRRVRRVEMYMKDGIMHAREIWEEVDNN